ncbi:hypothetical protein [Clostridium thermarum]|uniref:hypothetical protein n=1 Tax=Clostridium thermarum TaxID=1716543 RepID=UPI0013D7C7E1|nr:hypothetical protein [Clostridium thermarum]
MPESEVKMLGKRNIELNSFVATLEIKGTEKIKQELKDIEDSLDRILEKFEIVAALEGQVQAQPKEINILINGKTIAKSLTQSVKNAARTLGEKIDTTILYPSQE